MMMPSTETPQTLQRDPRRLIFIRKKWTGQAGWSDAIERFFESIACSFAGATRFEVSVGSPHSTREMNRRLLAEAGSNASGVIVLLNHSICWWLVAPALMRIKRAGGTVCLCMHEHEQILGMRYALRHVRKIALKELLRYSRLFHRVPAALSSRVLVLSESQASILKVPDAIRTSFLPVDGSAFPPHHAGPRASGEAVAVLFAHDPARFDKGHRFVQAALGQTSHRLRLVYGRDTNLPFDQVYKKYWQADILFLPSDWESYSLVFIEALACNKLIVVSPWVGALRLLLCKYSMDALKSFGVYVSAHDGRAYARQLDEAAARVERGQPPTTRALFDEFSFGQAKLPTALL